MREFERSQVKQTLERLIRAFSAVLYETDDTFMHNMRLQYPSADNLESYRHWEWPQGVGLYGFWKLYQATGSEDYLNQLRQYYDYSLKIGLPGRNINTTAPMLSLAFLYEHVGEPKYGEACEEWANWLMKSLPRTKEGGFQHLTSDVSNEQELWDDTLYMAVLFLAKAAKLFNRTDWAQEAEYQFLLHAKYLLDQSTGLWYHGWTFHGNHHFVRALWGRGNCWITASIPEFIGIADPIPSVRRYLTGLLERQAESLAALQNEQGMWHTLLDDPSSYAEASATCGIGYGLLLATRMGLIDKRYQACAMAAVNPILNCTDEAGVLQKVSYGTPMGRDSKDFYRNIPQRPMPYGQALAIIFLLEILCTEDELDLESKQPTL